MTIFESIRTPQTVLVNEVGIRRPNHGRPVMPWVTDPEAILPAGLVWYRTTSGKVEPLKRAKTKADVVNSTVVSLYNDWAIVFAASDVLVSSDKIGISQFSGAWTGAEVITIQIDGGVSASINLADSATLITTAAGAAAFVVDRLGSTGYDGVVTAFVFTNATSGTEDIYFVSKQPGNAGAIDITVSVAGGTGAATDPAVSTNIAIGTVSAIDLEAHTVTLAVATDLPAGLAMKVVQPEVSLDRIKNGGMKPEQYSLNMFENIGMMIAGTIDVSQAYWDWDLAYCFPEMVIV